MANTPKHSEGTDPKALNIASVVKSLPLNSEPPQVIKDNGLNAKDWDNDCT